VLQLGLQQATASSIGSAIHRLRVGLGLTQEQMARRLEVTVSAYWRWETGRRVPSGDWLLKIMRLCPHAESLASFGIDIREKGVYTDTPSKQAPGGGREVKVEIPVKLRKATR